MKPNERFVKQPKHFWANVRTISELIGYTVRKERKIKVPSLEEMRLAMRKIGLTDSHIVDAAGQATEFGRTLAAYFDYRADALNSFVEPRLMNAAEASAAFKDLCTRLPLAKCPVPMNKQSGEKKAPPFLPPWSICSWNNTLRVCPAISTRAR